MSTSNLKYVYFDLETTGLKNPDIVQIGAVNADATDSFDDFAAPAKTFEPNATEVNKLLVKGDGLLYKKEERRLFGGGDHPERRVYTKPPRDILTSFLSWLRTDIGPPVVLVAYNALKFDARVLLTQLDRFAVRFDDVIVGFADPFVFLKERRLDDGSGMKQGDVMRRFGVEATTGDAHNAVNDAENLRRLTLRMSGMYPELLSPGGKHFATVREVKKF